MNKEQKEVWDVLQGNQYHQWVAHELIAKPVVEKRPFLDPVMSAGFILIALVAIGNLFR